MKALFVRLLIPALALIGVNFLVGCTQKGAAVHGVINPAPSPTLGEDGTSTSGGGTGIHRKVFESYIVDPTELPPVKQYLEPLFANIKASDPKDSYSYEVYFKMKTWFIAPVELKRIKKDVLGISFIKSSTQQIARQTMSEVWIDKRIYDTMAPRDQAELLLHEMIMGMYFLKFMSMKDICKLAITTTDEKNGDTCVNMPNILARAMAPEKPHPLNDTDNENIRYVTGWLLKNAQKPIPERDFIRVLYYKGFDKRFFKPIASSKLDDLKISGKELYRSIKGAEISGNMPTTCTGLTTETTKPCSVTVSESSITYQFQKSENFQLSGFNLRVAIQNESPINIFIYSGDKADLSPMDDGEGGVIYTYALAEAKTKIQIGDRLYSGFILFKKPGDDQSPLILESIIIEPGIVVSIDKKRDPVCLVRAPKVVGLLDDGILVTHKDSKPNIAQDELSATPPFAGCSDYNVSE